MLVTMLVSNIHYRFRSNLFREHYRHPPVDGCKHYQKILTHQNRSRGFIKNQVYPPTHKFYESFRYFHEKLGYILEISL